MGYYIVVAAIGLGVGMFLGVCIESLPYGVPLKEGLRKKIQSKNPLVEILTAVVYMLLFGKYSFSAEFIAASFLMSLLIPVFFIDLKYRIIPNKLVLAGLFASALLLIYRAVGTESIFGVKHWWEHLLGLLPGTGLFMLVAWIGSAVYKTDDAMGMGDVKILAPIGVFLGWKLCIATVFMSTGIAGLTGILLLLSGIKKRKDSIPFGPFIAVGTFVTLTWDRISSMVGSNW